jgi:hypothetical protein
MICSFQSLLSSSFWTAPRRDIGDIILSSLDLQAWKTVKDIFADTIKQNFVKTSILSCIIS